MPSVPRMPLAEFIDEYHEQIIREFCAFARALMPPGSEMTETDLRDHAKDMLMAIRVKSPADDLTDHLSLWRRHPSRR